MRCDETMRTKKKTVLPRPSLAIYIKSLCMVDGHACVLISLCSCSCVHNKVCVCVSCVYRFWRFYLCVRFKYVAASKWTIYIFLRHGNKSVAYLYGAGHSTKYALTIEKCTKSKRSWLTSEEIILILSLQLLMSFVMSDGKLGDVM